VEHPPWRIWQVSESQASVSIADLYGPAFVETLSRKPTSAFLAEGSPIVVYAGQRLA
jgi:hypothetical protein